MDQSDDPAHPSSFSLHPSIQVLLDHPHPAGSTGLTEAVLALRYDPSVLTVMPEGRSVRLATLATIHPKLPEALIGRAVDPRLKP